MAKKPKVVATPGATYEHFKGERYKVIAIATHSETGEPLVVYTDERGMAWARPRWKFEDGRYKPVATEA